MEEKAEIKASEICIDHSQNIVRRHGFLDHYNDHLDVCSSKSFDQMCTCTKYGLFRTESESQDIGAGLSIKLDSKHNSEEQDESCCTELFAGKAIFNLTGCKVRDFSNGICDKNQCRNRHKSICALSCQQMFEYIAKQFRHTPKQLGQHRKIISKYCRSAKRVCSGLYNNSDGLLDKDIDDLVTDLMFLSLDDNDDSAFCDKADCATMQSTGIMTDCYEDGAIAKNTDGEETKKIRCVCDELLPEKSIFEVNLKDALRSVSGNDAVSDNGVTCSAQTGYENASNKVICHDIISEAISFVDAGDIKDDEKSDASGNRFTCDHISSDSDDEINGTRQNYLTDKNLLKINENVVFDDKSNVKLQSLSPANKFSFFVAPSELIDSSEESDEDSHCENEDEWTSSDESTSDLLHDEMPTSFKWNGLYFPNKNSPGRTDLELNDRHSIMICPLSVNYETDSVSLSTSKSANNYNVEDDDDIVFSDGHDIWSNELEDEEDTEIYKMSRIEIINYKWNQAYSFTEDASAFSSDIKHVHFAHESILVTIHSETTSEAEAYAAARIGPWEECARDRDRFARRIRDTQEQLSWVLSQSHREKIYATLFN